MSEPTLICSAPALAQDAQRIALYSHYAVAVAGFGVGGLMIARSRVQEKLPHILAAVAAIGCGLVALYSQWEFNQYLYQYRETAVNAVMIRAALWGVWSTLLLIGLAYTPGFRFKRMKNMALFSLIACAVVAAGLSTAGEVIIAKGTTLIPTLEEVEKYNFDMTSFADAMKDAASTYPLALGLPALAVIAALIGVFVATQQKKVAKRSEESHQMRTGVMTTVAVCVPAVAYAAGMFVALSARGVSGSVLLFNCAEVMAMFFMFCATMSLVGTPANFPRPVKPKAEKKAAPDAEADAPTPANNQRAYAQYYAQVQAQQQAYAQYYAQQQQQAAMLAAQQQAAAQAQAAAQQAQTATASAQPTTAAVPAAQPTTAAPAGTTTPAQPDATAQQVAALQAQQAAAAQAAAVAYQQQQAQYYAQQQAYAAYQQQQQAYAAYQQQQQYSQQQQPYAQAYAQQQEGYRQSQRKTAVRLAQPGKPAGGAAPSAARGTVKKIGGPQQIKKIR